MLSKNKREKLREEHDKQLRIASEHVKNAKNIEKEIINSVSDQYIDKEERDKLIQQAKKVYYSEEKIKLISKVFEKYDRSKVTYNVAIEIMDAEKDIKEHNKESFFSTISNIVINEDKQ